MRSANERVAMLGSLVVRLQRCVTASGRLGGRTPEHRHFDAQLDELSRDVEAECDRLTSEGLRAEHEARLQRGARKLGA